MTNRHVSVGLNSAGDLVWSGHDLGPGVGTLLRGATEYEFWRTIGAADLPALLVALEGRPGDDVADLVRQRFDSDVALGDFAEAHGIRTVFDSWISTNWDD